MLKRGVYYFSNFASEKSYSKINVGDSILIELPSGWFTENPNIYKDNMLITINNPYFENKKRWGNKENYNNSPTGLEYYVHGKVFGWW